MDVETQQAHIIDDLVIEKRVLIHAVDDAISLLGDALEALRRDRSHVTDEFLERTIESLKKARAKRN